MTTEVAVSKAWAADVTARIKVSAVATYELIKEAYDGKAWLGLGYKSWREYTAAEFDMSASYAYRLVTQAKVAKQLTEAAASVSPNGDTSPVVLTEKEARDVAPLVGEVVEDIKQGTPVPEAVAKARAVPVTRVAKERVVFADEEPELTEETHLHECRLCGRTWA